jgi:transketolase
VLLSAGSRARRTRRRSCSGYRGFNGCTRARLADRRRSGPCGPVQQRNSRVFVVLGDGELGEASVWEGALIAAKHRLSSLTAIVDYNKLQSYGRVEDILPLEPLSDKWRAFGFCVREVDGHDVGALRQVFAALPFDLEKPSAVIAHTIKGRGVAHAESNPAWHDESSLDAAAIDALREAVERN